MGTPLIHIVGAGLGGLAAAVQLARRGRQIVLHEAAAQAGGRCRSYFEPMLGMEIDNGNHLVLSGNRQTMRYAGMLGTRAELAGPTQAAFDFVDLASAARWTLRPNGGCLPWWIFCPQRRVPGTRATDYLAPGRLMLARKGATIGETMACSGVLWERLWHPVLLAALNTEPREASAALAGAVIRESLARGGQACIPLIAAKGLSSAFVDPALTMLKARGSEIRFGQRLRALQYGDGRVAGLDFGGGPIRLGQEDQVILAVPSWVAGGLVPGLEVPQQQRAIINGHFRFDAPGGAPAMLGLVNAMVEWIFVFPGRISITISGADRLLDVAREQLAATFWREIQAALGIAAPMPAWQVIKEKRATFAALPGEDARRPAATTAWRNLFLAGDYTATGLPATIEGAVRSGFKAAELAEGARV